MNPVTTSIFDLFKIGPGPSSSHTIAPMLAGYDFQAALRRLPPAHLARARRLEVRLFGSLAATGHGHGTDCAVVAGLLGHRPDTCPDEAWARLLGDPRAAHVLDLAGRPLPVSAADVIFDPRRHRFPYSNTLVLRLRGARQTIFAREYYSVGGGFLQWKGAPRPRRGRPRYRYATARQVRDLLHKDNLLLHEMLLENEQAITGCSEAEICAGIDVRLQAMEDAIRRGVAATGLLPGPLGLHRKAFALHDRARRMDHVPDHFLMYLCAYAFAVAEENAAGHRVVTAPTCGSAGVVPAIYYVMKQHLRLPAHDIRQGFLAAALVGFLAKHNASLAGAEVGCQGEVGVAAAMAAAMLAYAQTANFQPAMNAAETALEHHLGMTCDPVDGLVQIPCIERNALGAVKAYTAALISSTEPARYHRVGLDDVITAMNETGRDLCAKYRETARGGLARVIRC